METSSGSSPSPPDPLVDLPSRSARSSITDQTRKARRSKDERAHNGFNMRDVARVLVARDRETMDHKRTLDTLTEQLKAERQRADAAENKTREVIALFKNSSEAKVSAEQASARANEELRLYKLQYENAREELRRAQKLIDSLEAQRIDAEETAAKARSMARKLKEEKIIMRAREEGRRAGIQEGLAQGRVMGYEEGRAAGYESGREATERAYTSAPVTEMEFGTPRQRHYDPPQVSRPSSSEESDPGAAPNYTQPMDNNMPVPAPVTTPARIPTPAEAPTDSVVHPVPVHNTMFSPSHPPTDIPPDGWIPNLDGDMRIRLPPPHEMAPPPPTPSPPLSAVLNNVKNIPDEPVMIPPPEPEPSRRPKHRRRNSTESQSTTMSQFEILGPPSIAPSTSTLRPSTRERPNVLSAIAEERERTSSASSPVYDLPNLSTQSFQMPTAVTMPSPSPSQQMPTPSQHPPPPQNPVYPDTTPRYATRSSENLARSSSDDYYRTTTPRYGGSETNGMHRSASDAGSRYGDPPRTGSAYGRAGSEAGSRYGSEEPNRTRSAFGRSGSETGSRYGAEEPPRTGSAFGRAGSESGSRYGAEEPPRAGSAYGRPGSETGSRSGSAYGRSGSDDGRRGTPAGNVHRYPNRDNGSRFQNIYAPPHSPHSSPDTPSPAIAAPQPSIRHPPPNQMAPENRGSMSSNEINFTIVPPSRPESNISRTEGIEPHRSFLSAEDADRPLPSTPTEPDPSTQPPAPTSPVIPTMRGQQWPPAGFVPMGPQSPSQGGSTVGPAGVPLPPSSYAGSTVGPAGVPLPPSVYGGTPSVRSEGTIPGGFPGADGPPPVIPLQPSTRSSQSGSSRHTAPNPVAREPYSRSAISKRRDEDDTDSSVSSGMGSADSLTTPPPRTRKLSTRGTTTPGYAAAPLPPNVVYPASPTPRSHTMSLGSQTGRAARVPLPASTIGVGSRSNSGGMRTPSDAGGRPRSPLMGGRSPSVGAMSLPVPEPVIPIPIPEPSPITMPVVFPSSPRRPTTPLADIEPTPVIPPPSMARAASPVMSAVSGTTTATATTKGKKGKKKR